MNFKKLALSLMLSTALVSGGNIVLPEEALAFDATLFIKGLQQEIEEDGGKLEFDRMTEQGNGVVLDNVRIEEPDEDTVIEITSVTLSDVEELSPDHFLIGNFMFKDYRQESETDDGDVRLTAREILGSDMELKGDESDDENFPVTGVTSLELVEISVEGKGDEGPYQFNTGGLTLSDFSYDNSKAFKIGTLSLEPLAGEAGKRGARNVFGFEGFSVSGFERFAELGFSLDSFEIGSATLSGTTEDKVAYDVQFAGGTGENFYLPDYDNPQSPIVTDKPVIMNIGKMVARANGKEFVGWESATANYGLMPDTRLMDSKMAFNSMFIDFSAVPQDQSGEEGLKQLRELGYERIGLNLFADGTWDMDSGLVDLTRYRFEFQEAGVIDMNMKIGGYTEQIARSINTVANQMNAEPDPKKKNAMAMQLLASMATLNVQDMELNVTDGSLLGKLLDYQAKQSGQNPEDIAAIAGPMIGITLAPFNIPEFAGAVSSAVSTFMQGNRTITASIKPAGGLAVTEIIALSSGVQAGTITPAEIIQRLDLKVSAE